MKNEEIVLTSTPNTSAMQVQPLQLVQIARVHYSGQQRHGGLTLSTEAPRE